MSEPAKTPSFVEAYWRDQRDLMKVRRLEAEAQDPGYPSTYGTCTGEPTPAPWAAVVGARNKLPVVLDLNKLKASVFKALGVKL